MRIGTKGFGLAALLSGTVFLSGQMLEAVNTYQESLSRAEVVNETSIQNAKLDSNRYLVQEYPHILGEIALISAGSLLLYKKEDDEEDGSSDEE